MYARLSKAVAAEDEWRLGEAQPFSGAAAACQRLGSEWAFEVPRDGYSNSRLAATAARQVWLNFHQLNNGRWSL